MIDEVDDDPAVESLTHTDYSWLTDACGFLCGALGGLTVGALLARSLAWSLEDRDIKVRHNGCLMIAGIYAGGGSISLWAFSYVAGMLPGFVFFGCAAIPVLVVIAHSFGLERFIRNWNRKKPDFLKRN